MILNVFLMMVYLIIIMEYDLVIKNILLNQHITNLSNIIRYVLMNVTDMVIQQMNALVLLKIQIVK